VARTKDQIDVLAINWHDAVASRHIGLVVLQKSLT
jgi:hypothetical protein